MKIGTAAPTPEQLSRVPHWFVGTLELTDYYSAAQYETDVLNQLECLFQTHDTVVLTGGSMMYVDAICKGIDDIPTVDKETRELMLQRYEKEGLDKLCAELKLLDPEYYKIVDLKNPKRVIHALEICYMTGKTYSSFRTRNCKERPFRIIKIGLTRDREELYDPHKPPCRYNDARGITGRSTQRLSLQRLELAEYSGVQRNIQISGWRMDT